MAADELDVAIVGAGVSGVWCGWRLTGESAGEARRKSVAVFELSDRVGGRLLSVRLPGLPDVACELGGMRYMSTQPYVKWLVEEELQLHPIPAPVAQPGNLAYLRGSRLRISELTDSAQLLFRLKESEQADPGDLLANAIVAIAPKTKGKTGDALRKAVQETEVDGKPLAHHGFWNLIARVMSHEAYLYAQQAGGYDTTQLNWNAADTIVLNADFTPTVEFHRVAEGYEEVPLALEKRFVDQGGELHLQHGVQSIAPAELSDGTEGVELQIDAPDGRKTVRAKEAILALPRRSLELLDPTGPVLGAPAFRRLLGTVEPIPLFKSFVAYHEPWWSKSLGIETGRSVTDLPLRQVYYWSTTPNESSVLLATYDDTLNVSFWQGLAGDPQSYGLKLGHVPERAKETIRANTVDDRWESHPAPAALVHEIHRQLAEMHGIPDAPPPYAGVYHDWIEDPFGGGVNFWQIGVKSWEVIPKMAHPVAGAPVYVCGEAYSDAQGWVEGALRTAELVLTGHLGLPALPVPAA